ncbi:iron-sulfur cluster insertion protein ErpA [Methylophaga sp. OBS4]|uniref:iron-sulfur cluster insertion protein ErpA n=1 Tax=Methylophaga sp. OBS4 TaxID=2991935 RepID=UPI00225AB1CD|nr:iron-sulfur cluster insertion protein ErpA [Methylophaga sp. OBS4]MCX4188002.1 iron-sulfur cluster insertion protein ErpA [Methylophaga sp. OBS4]
MTSEMPSPIIFTEAAATKVSELIADEGNDQLKLRVFITGGGCSGFQYGFTFEEEVSAGDTQVEKGGVTLLIDPASYQYLVGAEIDYTDGVEGSQFVIRNPNATTTCGCGSSFSP